MALNLSLIVTILLAIVALSAVGYVLLFIKPTKKVLLLRPRDHRGKTLSIIQETDLALTCKAIKNVTHWFIKYGASWVFNEGGRMITRFFGVEGTAYTTIASIPNSIDVSVAEFLEALWGSNFYTAIPDRQKKMVEEDRVGITIRFKKLDAEAENLPTLTASDINDENEQNVLNKLTKPMKGSTSKTIMESITMLIVGAGLMYFIVKQGYI